MSLGGSSLLQTPWAKMFTAATLAGAALSLALFLVRAFTVISFSEPVQAHTTGDEFTNFFYIWKQTKGLPVYNNRFEIPYSGTVYNWLFHEAYGDVTSLLQIIFNLEDAWQPTIGRLFSLLAVTIGVFVAYGAFKGALQAPGLQTPGLQTPGWREKALCLGFAVFIMFGPLLGFWVLTVRADLWAMTFEMAAAALFLAHYPKRKIRAVLLLAVAVYVAWSFKQGNVFAAAGAGLLLLARRDWKPLAVLVIFLPSIWALTFLLGDKAWARTILFSDYPMFLTMSKMLRNLANFSIKTAPVLFFIAASFFVVTRCRGLAPALWRNDAVLFASGSALAGLMLILPVSAQQGGAENYYFTFSFFLSLLIMAGLPVISPVAGNRMKAPLYAGSIGWLLVAAAIILVLTGAVGVTDVRTQHVAYTSMKRCADSLPRPLFINSPYMGLPWMTPGNTPFVFSYVYFLERSLGRPFQHGGFGGLISKGAFAAIALRVTEDEITEFDGGTLSRYQQTPWPECPNVVVFLRKAGDEPEIALPLLAPGGVSFHPPLQEQP